MSHIRSGPGLCLLALLFSACWGGDEASVEMVPDAFSAAERDAPLSSRLVEPGFGDLAQMRERGLVRVLVSGGPTAFTIEDGRPRGFEVEMLEAWENDLNADLAPGELPLDVVYVPLRFDAALPALRDGRGDLVAAGLTVTPERSADFDFTDPYIANVDEIVVTHTGVEGIGTLKGLAGRSVHVASGSSFGTHLVELSGRLVGEGLPAIDVVTVDARLSEEDVLELVHSGAFELTVADSHVATIWARALDGLRVRPDLIVHGGGSIAWAVRKESPELRRSLNEFVARHRKGTLLGNILFRRYFDSVRWLENPLSSGNLGLLDRYDDLFREHAQNYGFDWLQIAAQAYQESGFDPSRTSARGAVGLMQVLPSTAADRSVGIPDVSSDPDNVHAGVKYMAFLRDRYFSEPGISPEAQYDLSLAAYNMGPARLASLRKTAAERGLDANVWFGNVETVALERVGREPVRYVANVNKYYVAYSWALEGKRD